MWIEMQSDIVPLILLQEGEEGIIRSVAGGPGLVCRLASMGLTFGIKIRVLRNIGGPLIITTNGTRIAIGRGQSQKIVVRRLISRQEKAPLTE
ncbi:MAG: FeoA family protein [Nitrospirota bacterium]